MEISKRVGNFSSFDGTQIYYECRGEGSAVIFIYGIACLMNHWHHQTEHFSKSHETILFDIRGHHKSQTPSSMEQLTVRACAEDVISLIDHLGLKSVHLVGHSFGVPLAILVAAKRTDCVKSVCLINGFAQNPIKGMFGLDVIEPFYQWLSQQYAANRTLVDLLWKNAVNNPLSMWATGLLGGFNLNVTHFKDIEIYARGVSQLPLDNFLHLFGDMIKFDGTQECSKIIAPTLVINGEQDKVTPLKFQKDLADSIKNSEFIRVPYGSHCTQLDFPDYVNLLLEKHFKKAEGR